MDTLEVVLNARALLSERGLAKYTMINRATGSLCVRGAIRLAQSGKIRSIYEYNPILDCQEHAIVRLAGFIDAERAAWWNNEPERTLEDVLAMFDTVAERVRAGETVDEKPPFAGVMAMMLDIGGLFQVSMKLPGTTVQESMAAFEKLSVLPDLPKPKPPVPTFREALLESRMTLGAFDVSRYLEEPSPLTARRERELALA
jgi:hypothetical protein